MHNMQSHCLGLTLDTCTHHPGSLTLSPHGLWVDCKDQTYHNGPSGNLALTAETNCDFELLHILRTRATVPSVSVLSDTGADRVGDEGRGGDSLVVALVRHLGGCAQTSLPQA